MTSIDPKPRRNSSKPPKFRKHRSGQLAADFNGKTKYFGLFDDPKSEQGYWAYVAEWNANGRQPIKAKKAAVDDADGITVVELAALYDAHAQRTYVKNGKPTSEAESVKLMMRRMGEMFDELPAEQFSHRHFVQIRNSMIELGNARSTIGHHMRRVRTLFRWAAEHDHVSFEVAARLSIVRPLKRGSSGVREAKPVTPANDDDVKKVQEAVRPFISAAIEFQRRTGCRAGEMFQLRPCDLTPSSDPKVFIYKPLSHKTESYGERIIPVGERAMEAIRPYLDKTAPTDFVFRQPDGPFRGRLMTPQKFSFAVKRGCIKAKVARWRPHQLRHARLTELRNAGMLEQAQAVAGHKTLQMTQHYAKLDMQKGIDAALQGG